MSHQELEQVVLRIVDVQASERACVLLGEVSVPERLADVGAQLQ